MTIRNNIRLSLAFVYLVGATQANGVTINDTHAVTSPYQAVAPKKYKDTVSSHSYFTRWDDIGQHAKSTGDTKMLVEQTLVQLGFSDLDAGTKAMLVSRLKTAEIRFSKDIEPFIRSNQIADTYNSICHDSSKIASCTTVNSEQVKFLHLYLIANAPNFFSKDSEKYSPVEALVVIFLIVYNNGAILPASSQSMTSEGGHSTVQARSGFPLASALQLSFLSMKNAALASWIDNKLKLLNI